MKRGVAVALALVIGGRLLLHALLYGRGFESLTADEFARVLVAAHWAEAPSALFRGQWPPLHFYVLGSALALHFDLLWTPRVVAIAAGAASLVLVYAIGRALDGPATGIAAAVALAVHPSHLWLSSTPLSEGLHALLCLVALAATLRFAARGGAATLLAAALALAAASATRYEGWLLSAAFAAFVVVHARRAGAARAGAGGGMAPYLGALLVVAAFPVAWLLMQATIHSDALAFVEEVERHKGEYAAQVGGDPATLGSYARVVAAIDPFVVPTAAAGAFLLLRRRTGLALAYGLLAVLPLPVFVLAHWGHVEPHGNLVRYLSPFLWLLVPLGAYGAVGVVRDVVKPGPARVAVLGLALLALVVWQVRHALSFTNDPAAAGLGVGRALVAARAAEVAGRAPAMVELRDLEFLAVHAGASDVRGILYDRALDRRSLAAVHDALAPSWPEPWRAGCGGLGDLADAAAWRRCLRVHDVRFAAAASPRTRRLLEQELAASARGEVNGYAIYVLPDGEGRRAGPVGEP